MLFYRLPRASIPGSAVCTHPDWCLFCGSRLRCVRSFRCDQMLTLLAQGCIQNTSASGAAHREPSVAYTWAYAAQAARSAHWPWRPPSSRNKGAEIAHAGQLPDAHAVSGRRPTAHHTSMALAKQTLQPGVHSGVLCACARPDRAFPPLSLSSHFSDALFCSQPDDGSFLAGLADLPRSRQPSGERARGQE